MDKERLEYVSAYSAGSASTDDMSTGQFEYLLAQATLVFTEVDTGLTSSAGEYCKLLLVAHLYECSQGRTGFSSEGIGDYSYSRIPGVLTSYKQQAQDFLNTFAGSSTYQTSGATRCDKAFLPEFALDNEEQRGYPTL